MWYPFIVFHSEKKNTREKILPHLRPTVLSIKPGFWHSFFFLLHSSLHVCLGIWAVTRAKEEAREKKENTIQLRNYGQWREFPLSKWMWLRTPNNVILEKLKREQLISFFFVLCTVLIATLPLRFTKLSHSRILILIFTLETHTQHRVNNVWYENRLLTFYVCSCVGWYW